MAGATGASEIPLSPEVGAVAGEGEAAGVGVGVGAEAGGDATFRVNCVVLVRLPPVPVTTTVEVPGGVDALVPMVTFIKQDGVH